MTDDRWHRLGTAETFARRPLQEVLLDGKKVALSHKDGVWGAVSGVCNHAGGPLGTGTLDGEYIVCPWHHWKFHRGTGEGEPGFEEDRVPRYDVRVENGDLFISREPVTARSRKPHPKHPLTRPVERAPGPTRVVGISTTAMDEAYPRESTSERLLAVAMDHARDDLGCETKTLRLSALQFRQCEGYYSKSAHACTWPCSITQMDPEDQMEQVYEALIHWADVVLIATPIRWGAAGALYFKMAERLNCVQNQITIRDRVLVQNKVASFIITGGQDNVQGVAGQMLTFFSELGFLFPQFPFIGHSRGWSAEDMEHNIEYVMDSKELQDGARGLVARAVAKSRVIIAHEVAQERIDRGGRKAHTLNVIR